MDKESVSIETKEGEKMVNDSSSSASTVEDVIEPINTKVAETRPSNSTLSVDDTYMDIDKQAASQIPIKGQPSDVFDDLANYIIFNATDATRSCSDVSTASNASGVPSKVMAERLSSNDSGYSTATSSPLFDYSCNNSCSVDNVHRFPECTPKYVWKPGFCLQLGSQGRKAMLQLLRTTYKSDKSYKQVFEKKNPPTTISNLPFFKVAMLWELAHDFGVFDKAIEIHYCFGRCRGRSSVTRVRKTNRSCNNISLGGRLGTSRQIKAHEALCAPIGISRLKSRDVAGASDTVSSSPAEYPISYTSHANMCASDFECITRFLSKYN